MFRAGIGIHHLHRGVSIAKIIGINEYEVGRLLCRQLRGKEEGQKSDEAYHNDWDEKSFWLFALRGPAFVELGVLKAVHAGSGVADRFHDDDADNY